MIATLASVLRVTQVVPAGEPCGALGHMKKMLLRVRASLSLPSFSNA
jgi:hypothetical protein